MKKVFIICPVRLADLETKEKLEVYAKGLEEKYGYQVHLPHRDTDQAQSGLDICLQNAHAISAADEIHVFYDPRSAGIHFDMGVAFAMDIICGGVKKIVIVENWAWEVGQESFPKILHQWAAFRNDLVLKTDPSNGTY